MANPGHSRKCSPTRAAEGVVVMRLILDTSAVTFQVTRAAEARKDFGKDVQKVDRRHGPPAVGRGGARPGQRKRGGDPGHGDW